MVVGQYKKTFVGVIISLLFVFAISGFAFAVVDKNQQWLPLQQIAINSQSYTSVDENNNGIIDNAEKLNGYSDQDFLKTNGGTLKGVLFLYYGVGKIVDLDNPSYYIDPSYLSNFRRLCVNQQCINSWEDISSYITSPSINESFVREIVGEQIHLMEGMLNVNSSIYASTLMGVKRSDLLNILDLKSLCIQGVCKNGINAISLEGHRVGDNISNIPVIDPDKIYNALKVGYASVSAESNNTLYVYNMKAEDLVNTLRRLNNTYTSIYVDLNDLRTSNITIWRKINEIMEQLNDKEGLIIDALKDARVKDALKEYLLNQGFLNVVSCESNKNNMLIISKTGNKYKIECKSFGKEIKKEISNKLKNKRCWNGIMKGFNGNGDIHCENYASLSDSLINSGYLKNKLENYFILKPTCSDEEVVIFDDGKFKCISKSDLAERMNMPQCTGTGVLVNEGGNYNCLSYSTIVNNLINKGNLLDRLRYNELAFKDWVNSNFVKIPSCSGNEILIYDSNNMEFECKRLSISTSYSLIEDSNVYYVDGLSTTSKVVGGGDGETKTYTCPSGYVLVGIRVKYKKTAMVNSHNVAYKIGLICKRLNLHVKASYN